MDLRDRAVGLLKRLAGRRPSAEDERLVALFRNRAELKKELASIDDERHRLLDRLKLQEGSTMRVEEQLATLEDWLGRPEEGRRSLVYFQLKGLWRTASRRLEEFAEELARQQKDRERHQQLIEFDREKRARLADVDRELLEAQVLADQLQAEQKLAQQRLAGLQGFWHYFGRRTLEDEVQARAARIDAALTAVTDLGDRRHAIDTQAPPVVDELSTEGQRAVNLAVIACAEWLHERLSPGGLAELARQTTLRRVYETSYGDAAQCDALLEATARAAAALDGSTMDLLAIKERTERLRRTAHYRSDGDTVPTNDSVHAASGATYNVLAEDGFDLQRILLR